MKTTPDSLDVQLENLRQAIAWLTAHQSMHLYVLIGLQPKPVIGVEPCSVTTRLRSIKKYNATTTGRERRDGIEGIKWQATLFGCTVEWLEPLPPALPAVRLHVPHHSDPTVLRLLSGGVPA